MRQYNIPHLWRRDIATCGTYPDAFHRNLLWYDWTDTQKLHAQSRYNPVFDRLEELCELKKSHAMFMGDEFYGAYFNLNQVIDIDCSKQYTTAQLLKLVDEAIAKENDSFDKEMAELYLAPFMGEWED